MTNEQLEANRKCPFGGGRKDCPCNGNCSWLKYPPSINNDPIELIIADGLTRAGIKFERPVSGTQFKTLREAKATG